LDDIQQNGMRQDDVHYMKIKLNKDETVNTSPLLKLP